MKSQKPNVLMLLFTSCAAGGTPRPSPAETPGSQPTTMVSSDTGANVPQSKDSHPVPAAERSLVEYFTPEQHAALLERIAGDVDSANRNLQQWRARSDTPATDKDAERVEMFLKEAANARKTDDLVTARLFAERAALLSREILRRR